MKLTIDSNRLNLERRINQFIKYSKSGYIRAAKNQFINFDSGSIAQCRFDDESDEKSVIEAFGNLQDTKIEICIESSVNAESKIPYLEDYIVMKQEDLDFIAGNAKYEKSLKKLYQAMSNDLSSKLSWDDSVMFVRGLNRNFCLIFRRDAVVFAIFNARSTLSLVMNHIEKLY
ncbi:MAG: hypothetical protein R6U31_00555 [bacterium]